MVYEVGAKWNGDMDKDQVAVINRRNLVNMPLTRPHNDLKPKKSLHSSCSSTNQ